MKDIIIGIGIIVSSMLFSSCEKTDNTNDQKELIIGTWKLTGLVNISDQQKYLNTILEIKESKEYSNSEVTGDEILSGTCINLGNEDGIQLSSGLFEGYLVDYVIIKNDLDSLVLEEFYTLDGKQEYLEYHYSRLD